MNSLMPCASARSGWNTFFSSSAADRMPGQGGDYGRHVVWPVHVHGVIKATQELTRTPGRLPLMLPGRSM